MRDRVLAQRVGIGLDGKRRAGREADAAMIAGAGIAVDTEALAHYSLAVLDGLANQRLLAALLVEHALRLCHDDLGSRFLRCHRLAPCVAPLFEVVDSVDRMDPAAADAAEDRKHNRRNTCL